MRPGAALLLPGLSGRPGRSGGSGLPGGLGGVTEGGFDGGEPGGVDGPPPLFGGSGRSGLSGGRTMASTDLLDEGSQLLVQKMNQNRQARRGPVAAIEMTARL